MRKLLIIKLLIFIFNILLCASLSLPPSSSSPSSSLTSHNALSDLILNREKRYKRDLTYCNGLSQPNYLTTILQKPYENDEASFWEKYMNFLPTPNNWIPTLTRAIYDANPNHNCNPTPTATATVQYINAPSSSSSGSVSSSPLTPLSPPLSTVTTTTTTTTTTAANRHHPHSSQIGTNLNYNALHHQPPVTAANDGILRIINDLPVVNNDEVDVVGDGFVSGTTNLNIPLIPLKTNYYDTDFHKISDDDPAFKEALKLAKVLSNTDIFEKSNQLPTCSCGNKNIPNKCSKCLFQKQIKSKRNDNGYKANENTNCIQKDTTVPEEKDACKKFQSKFHYKPNEYKMNGFYESVQKLVQLFSEEKLKELHKKSEEQRQKVLKKQEEDDNSMNQSEKSSQNNDLVDQTISETTIFHEKQQNMIGDQETQEDKPPTEEERIKEQIIEKEQTENIANDEVKISENPIFESNSQENVPESTIEKPIMINESENDQTIIESEKGNVNDESSGNLEIQNDEIFSEISPEKEDNDKTNIAHHSGIVSNVQEIEESKMNEDDNLEHKDLTQDESAIQSVQIEKSKSSEIFMNSEQNERSINSEMTQTTEINEDQHFANTETAEEKIDLPRSEQEIADDANEDKSDRDILSQILPGSSDDDNTVRVNEQIETLQSSQKSRESENENKLAEENLSGQLFPAVGDRDDDEKIQEKFVNLDDKSETASSTSNSNLIEDEISLLGILPRTDENTDDKIETQTNSAEKTDNNKFSETQMQSENSGDVIDDEVELLPTSEKYEENQSDTESAESDSLEKVVEYSDGTLIDRGSESALSHNQNTESREVELLPTSENVKNLEFDSKGTENAVNMENRSENEMNLLQNSEKEFQEDDGTREINEVEAHKSIEPSGHSLIFHEGLNENESEKSDQNTVQNNEKSSANPDEFDNKNEPVVLDSILLENINPTLEVNNPTEVDSEHQSAEFFPSIVTIPDQSQEQSIPLNLGTETGTITKYTYQIVPDDDLERSKIILPEENIIDNTEMQNMDENLHPLSENQPQTFVENFSDTGNEKEETFEFLPNISEHLVTSETQHLGSNTAEVEKDEITPELLPNNSERLLTSEAQHFDSNTAEDEKENETTPELLPDNSDLVTSEAQHSDSNTAEVEKENETTPELLPDSFDFVTSEAQHSDSNTAEDEKENETTPELLPDNSDLVTSEAQHSDSNTAEVEKENETTPELLPDSFDLVTSEAQHSDSNTAEVEKENETTLELLADNSNLVTSEAQHSDSNTAEVERENETTPELLPGSPDLVTSEAQHSDSNTAEVEKENETTPELLPDNSDLVTSEAQHFDSNTAEDEKENETTPELLPDNSDLVTSEAQHSDSNTAEVERENETTPELLPDSSDLVTSEAQHSDSNTAEVEKENETTPELFPDNSDLVTPEAQQSDTNIAEVEKENETTPELLPDNFDLVTSEAQHLDTNAAATENDRTTPELLPNNSEHLETSETQHHSFIDASSSDNSQTKSENHSYNSVTNAQSISTPEQDLDLLNSILDVVDFVDSEKTDNVPSELLASNQNSDTVTNSVTLKDNNNGGQTAESIDLKHEINSTQELEGSASNVYDVVSNPQPLSPSHVDDNVLPQPSELVSINSLPALISLPGVALYFNRMLVEDKVPTIGMSLHVNKAVIKHLPCGEHLDNQQKEESENIPVTIPYEESENDVPEHNDEEDDSNPEHESSCPVDSEMESDSQYTTDFNSQITGSAENKNEDISPTEISKLPLLDETQGNNSAEKVNPQEDSYTQLNLNPHENDVVYNSRPVLISYPTAVSLSQPSNVDIKPNTEPYTLSPLSDPIQNKESVEVDTATNILQHQPVPVHDHDNISEEHSHPLHPNEVQYQVHTLPVAHYDDHHDHGVEIKQASTYNEEAKLEPSNELLADSENYHNERILQPAQESQNQLQFTNPIEPHFYHIPYGEKLLMTENPSRSDLQSENMNLSTEDISPPTPIQENIQPLTVENISPLMINVLPKISVPVTPPHDMRMQNEVEPPSFIPKYNPLFSKHKLKLLLGEALNKKMSQKLPKYATKLLSFHDLDMQGSEIYSKLENLKATKISETPEPVVYSGNNQKIDSPINEVMIPNEHNIQEVSKKNSLVNPNEKMVFEPKTKPITTPSTIFLDEHQSTELETVASQQSNVVVKSPNSIVSTDQENKENSKIEKSNSKKSDSKMPELFKSHTINPIITSVNQANHPASQHRVRTMTPPGVQQKFNFKAVTLSSSENEKYHRPNEKFKNPSENKATSMIDNLKAEIQEDNAQPTSLNEMNSGSVEKKLSKSELYNESNESKGLEMDDSRTSTNKFALELYTVLDEIVEKYLQTRLGDELNMKHDEMKLNDSFSKSAIQNQFLSKKFKRENKNENQRHKKGLDNRKDKLQTSASNIVTKYVLAPSSVIEMNDHHMISPTIATSENHHYDTKVLPEQSFLSKLLKKILSESENKKISQLAHSNGKLLSTVSDVFAEEIQNKLNPNEFNNFLNEFSSLNKIPKQFSESTPELSELEKPPVNGEKFFNLRNDDFEGQATTQTNDELSSFEQSNVPHNLKKVTFHMNSDQISEEQSDDVSTEKNQMLNKKPNRHDHHYEDNECCSSELHQLELNPSPAPLPRTSHGFDYPFETDEPHPLNIRPSLPTFLTGNGCSHLKISNSIQNIDQTKHEHETKDTNPLISLRSHPSLQSPLSINDHQDPIDIYRNRRQKMKPWFEEYETPPTPYTPSESLYNSVESSSSHRALTKRSIKDQNFKRSTILNDKKDRNVVIRNPYEQNKFWKSLLKGMEQEFTLKDLIQNKNNKKKIKTENQQKILSKIFVKKSHNNNQKKKNYKEKNKNDSKYSCETEVLNIKPIIEHDNAHLINDSSRSSKENESQQVPKLSSVSKQNLSNSDDSSTNLSNETTTSEEFIDSGSIEE